MSPRIGAYRKHITDVGDDFLLQKVLSEKFQGLSSFFSDDTLFSVSYVAFLKKLKIPIIKKINIQAGTLQHILTRQPETIRSTQWFSTGVAGQLCLLRHSFVCHNWQWGAAGI